MTYLSAGPLDVKTAQKKPQHQHFHIPSITKESEGTCDSGHHPSHPHKSEQQFVVENGIWQEDVTEAITNSHHGA